MLDLLLDPVKSLIALTAALTLLDILLRLIPTKKSISLLTILARLIAKVALLVGKISKLLPENRSN